MMGLSGFVVLNKDKNITKHLRHEGLDSWKKYISSIYNQQYHGFSLAVHFPFPSQDINRERQVGERMNEPGSEKN
jgi:hypothetical protein